MLLDIDLKEVLLMITWLLCMVRRSTTYRSTKALKNEIAQKPEVPDIVQMASLIATGFKVVDKEGYKSSDTEHSTSTLPGRVDRVEQKLAQVGQELIELSEP